MLLLSPKQKMKNKKDDCQDKIKNTNDYSNRFAQNLKSLCMSLKFVAEQDAWSNNELTKEQDTLKDTVLDMTSTNSAVASFFRSMASHESHLIP